MQKRHFKSQACLLTDDNDGNEHQLGESNSVEHTRTFSREEQLSVVEADRALNNMTHGPKYRLQELIHKTVNHPDTQSKLQELTHKHETFQRILETEVQELHQRTLARDPFDRVDVKKTYLYKALRQLL